MHLLWREKNYIWAWGSAQPVLGVMMSYLVTLLRHSGVHERVPASDAVSGFSVKIIKIHHILSLYKDSGTQRVIIN